VTFTYKLTMVPYYNEFTYAKIIRKKIKSGTFFVGHNVETPKEKLHRTVPQSMNSAILISKKKVKGVHNSSYNRISHLHLKSNIQG